MQTPYEILGLLPNATAEEIRSTYKKLAAKHHPDKHENSAEATEIIKKINGAYELLGDPKARALYDNMPQLSLLQAVLNGDIDAIKLAAAQADYFIMTAKSPYPVGNGYLALTPLEIAIAKGSAPMVQAHLTYLKFFLFVLNGQLDSDQGNIFSVATRFYNRDVFLLLVNKLKEQHKNGCWNANKMPASLFPDINRYMTFVLQKVLNVPLVSYEPIDLLIKEGGNLYDKEVLQNLFYRNSNLKLKHFIETYGASNFIKKAIHYLDTNMICKLGDLGYSLDKDKINPYAEINQAPTEAANSGVVIDWILGKLANSQAKLTLKDMLDAVSYNGLSLLRYLNGTFPYLSLSKQDYRTILFTLLTKRAQFAELEINICRALQQKVPDIYELCDDQGNNCLHIAAGRQNTLPDFTSNFLKFLQESLVKCGNRASAKITLSRLVQSPNKEGKIPAEMIRDAKNIPKLFSELKKRPADSPEVSAPNKLTSPPPAATFFSAPSATVIFHTLLQAIADRNIAKLTQLVPALAPAILRTPEVGYCLLAKAIASSELQCTQYLLSYGCNIFLKQDNPYAKALFHLSTDKEILAVLNQEAQKVNNARGIKRAQPSDQACEPNAKIAKIAVESDISQLPIEKDDVLARNNLNS